MKWAKSYTSTKDYCGELFRAVLPVAMTADVGTRSGEPARPLRAGELPHLEITEGSPHGIITGKRFQYRKLRYKNIVNILFKRQTRVRYLYGDCYYHTGSWSFGVSGVPSTDQHYHYRLLSTVQCLGHITSLLSDFIDFTVQRLYLHI